MKKVRCVGLVLFILLCISCKRKGCTDKDAINFCMDCNMDDGTCLFKTSYRIWYDTITRDSLLAHNIRTLKFGIDNTGQPIQAWVAKHGLSSAPGCDEYGIFNQEIGVKKDEVVRKYYIITDTFNNKIWDGYLESSRENPCIIIQRKWKE